MIRRRRACARRDNLNQGIRSTRGCISLKNIIKNGSCTCSNLVESFWRGTSDEYNVVVIMANVPFPFILRTMDRERLRIGVINGTCSTIFYSAVTNDYEF